MKIPFPPAYLAAQLLFLLSPPCTAQDLSSLPSCAQTPALAALGTTGCRSSDFACICQNSDFINTALAGARSECSEGALQRVLAFAQQLCAGVGVTITGDATSPASTSTPQTTVRPPSQTNLPSTSQTILSTTPTSLQSSAVAATAATTNMSVDTSSAVRGLHMGMGLVWATGACVGDGGFCGECGDGGMGWVGGDGVWG